MSLFPFHNEEDIKSPSKDPLALYREVAWDFKKDEPIIENGNFKMVEGNEAIKIWCYKAIKTPRFQYQIYSWDYGSEVMSLIGKAYTPSLTQSELKRYIEEALSINEYILEVNVLDTSFKNTLLSANVKIKTIYEGEVEVIV